MISTDTLSRWQTALPFWVSFLLIPILWFTAFAGGWWVLLVPLSTWWLFAALDGLTGLNLENADPETPEDALRWYVLLTKAWVPVQFFTLYGLIWYATRAEHLSSLEKIGLFFGMGVISGTIGINYSHELMHQKGRLERWLGDILLAMVLYSDIAQDIISATATSGGPPIAAHQIQLIVWAISSGFLLLVALFLWVRAIVLFDSRR